MTEVKICGIGNTEDALAACEAGADALGFIFYPKSPRYVEPVTAKEIIKTLPGDVAKIGVFVDQPLLEIRRIFMFCALDFIQVHGNEPLGYCRRIPPDLLIKAVRLETGDDLIGIGHFEAKAFLVDSADPIRHGGTGRLSNWELAAVLAEKHSVILAGGLNPQNVHEAIRRVLPAAVDVGSGVEKEPGRKDHERMRVFIQEARAANGYEGTGGVFSKAASGCRRLEQ